VPKTAFRFRFQRKEVLRCIHIPTYAGLFEPLLQHDFVAAFDSAAADKVTLLLIFASSPF
jgi:hypothetical protein